MGAPVPGGAEANGGNPPPKHRDLGFCGAAPRALTTPLHRHPRVQSPVGTGSGARRLLRPGPGVSVPSRQPGEAPGASGGIQARGKSGSLAGGQGLGGGKQGPAHVHGVPLCCPPATHTPRPVLIPAAGLDCPPLSAVGTGPCCRGPGPLPSHPPTLSESPAQSSGSGRGEVPTATRERGQPPNVSADCPSLPSIISVHPLISGEGLAPIPILSEPSGEAQGGPPSRSTPGQLLPPRQMLRWGVHRTNSNSNAAQHGKRLVRPGDLRRPPGSPLAKAPGTRRN